MSCLLKSIACFCCIMFSPGEAAIAVFKKNKSSYKLWEHASRQLAISLSWAATKVVIHGGAYVKKIWQGLSVQEKSQNNRWIFAICRKLSSALCPCGDKCSSTLYSKIFTARSNSPYIREGPPLMYTNLTIPWFYFVAASDTVIL